MSQHIANELFMIICTGPKYLYKQDDQSLAFCIDWVFEKYLKKTIHQTDYKR